MVAVVVQCVRDKIQQEEEAALGIGFGEAKQEEEANERCPEQRGQRDFENAIQERDCAAEIGEVDEQVERGRAGGDTVDGSLVRIVSLRLVEWYHRPLRLYPDFLGI